MKTARELAGMLLVVMAFTCVQARAGQSDQNGNEIRQDGDRKVLVRVGGSNSEQANAAQHPVKKMSEQEMQVLEQQKSAVGGPSLRDASAVENASSSKSAFDNRPTLTQQTNAEGTEKKAGNKLVLVSKPDPSTGKSDVVEEIK